MASSNNSQPAIDMKKAMETPSRNLPFEPLSVIVAGVQIHKQTALSQYRNLYFIASFNRIHVYKPHFPNQTLDQKPQLIIDLPVSRPGLTGVIDSRRPHAVNHLIVGCLGDEEILLMACDDGDVLGYNTRNIFATINKVKDDEDASAQENKSKFLTPFFHENVGKSAWGLAIHKAARMIAVSCNAAEITVFAFALAKKHPEVSPNSTDRSRILPCLDSGDWRRLTHMSLYTQFTSPAAFLASPSRREYNFRLSMPGHYTNIPSIAFYNSDDDKEGRWLVSTDIDGAVLLWDVWMIEVVKKKILDDNTRYTRGWGVLCLDPRSFKDTIGKNDAFGCNPEIHATRPNVWDISISKEKPRDFTHNLSGVVLGWANNGDEEGGEEYEEDDEDESTEQNVFLELLEDGSNNHDFDLESDHSFSDENMEQLEEEDLELEDFEESDESDEEILEDIQGDDYDIDMVGGARTRVRRDSPATNADDIPYLPIFVSTVEHVRLLESIRLNESCVCLRLLETKVSDHLAYHLKQWERLNMLLYCPDLNLVVVGSQNGSVCLLTLTWGDDGELQGPAFRIEARLPFLSQDKAGTWSKNYLAGIAMGPIQGRELEVEGDETVSGNSMKKKEAWRRVERRRRYRLILYYIDGLILSYELGRDDERLSLLTY